VRGRTVTPPAMRTARAECPQAPVPLPFGQRVTGDVGAAGGVGACVFPLQFSPFGNPLSLLRACALRRVSGRKAASDLIPPFQSGPHQRGKTAGGQRTAALMENGASPA